MYYIFFDLEGDTAYSKRHGGFINEIIEVGAVRLDEQLREVDRFDTLIYPEVFRKLTGRITEMTGITTSDILEQGRPFFEVMELFERWLQKTPDHVLMSWSTSDLYMLLANLSYFTDCKTIPFLTRYADFQRYMQEKLEPQTPGRQMSLTTAAALAGLDESDLHHHRAVDDSVICADLLRAYFDPAALQKHILDATGQDFYDRLFFKPYYIRDLRSPLIDRSEMTFDCPDCGENARQRSRFRYRHKAFTAEFECPVCRAKFIGRVRFKKLYDRVQTIKFIQIPEEPEEAGSESDKAEPTTASN